MNDKKFYLLVFLICLPFLIFYFYYNLYELPNERQLFLKFGRYTVAEITRFDHLHVKREFFSKNIIPVYTFQYKNKKYTGSGYGIIQWRSKYQIDEEDVGKRYIVVFLPENPNKSSLLPYETYVDTIPSVFIIDNNGEKKLVQAPNVLFKDIPADGWTKFEYFGNRDIEHQE